MERYRKGYTARVSYEEPFRQTRPPFLVRERDPIYCCDHDFKFVKHVPDEDGKDLLSLKRCFRCTAVATYDGKGKLVEYDKTGEIARLYKADGPLA